MEFDWVYLTTVAGASVFTPLVVQAIKKIAGADIKKLWLRLVTWAVGFGLLLGANAIIYGLTLPDAGLCLVNSVVVYLMSTGAYKTVASK